ncbi:MAG: hypothetical protein HRT47_09270 [Candidatus Caenarcaniphilales bacterium]|nr:hypothetical protein [Candidatus Caenarcaniphilales bacterium]
MKTQAQTIKANDYSQITSLQENIDQVNQYNLKLVKKLPKEVKLDLDKAITSLSKANSIEDMLPVFEFLDSYIGFYKGANNFLDSQNGSMNEMKSNLKEVSKEIVRKAWGHITESLKNMEGGVKKLYENKDVFDKYIFNPAENHISNISTANGQNIVRKSLGEQLKSLSDKSSAKALSRIANISYGGLVLDRKKKAHSDEQNFQSILNMVPTVLEDENLNRVFELLPKNARRDMSKSGKEKLKIVYKETSPVTKAFTELQNYFINNEAKAVSILKFLEKHPEKIKDLKPALILVLGKDKILTVVNSKQIEDSGETTLEKAITSASFKLTKIIQWNYNANTKNKILNASPGGNSGGRKLR